MRYTLSELAEKCGGVLCEGGDGNRVFTRIDSDSRAIKDGATLFAAFRGDNFDGHRFAAELCEKGGAIIDDPGYACPNAILVKDVKSALYRLALQHRGEKLSHLKVLAITGSVGKTTTKNMAALVMGAHYKIYKSAGNRNSLTGLPMEILNIPEDSEWAVLEAGMSDPGEISKISALIKPEAAIITNIGHSHILAFGSREGICKEKLDITAGMTDVNLTMPDEPLLIAACKDTEGAVFCSVKDSGTDAYIKDVIEKDGFTRFTACYAGKETSIDLPSLGIHNVHNALLCFVCGVRLGVPAESAAAALGGFMVEGLRQSIRQTEGVTVIADCYNASPESMGAALSVLKTGTGKRIAVLGDMLELGEHAPRLHRLVGAAVVSAADILICVGSDVKYIAEKATEDGFAGENLYVFESEEYVAAAELLKNLLNKGDTVLFKASNRTNIRKVLELSGL